MAGFIAAAAITVLRRVVSGLHFQGSVPGKQVMLTSRQSSK
jgi:hypothetical protein